MSKKHSLNYQTDRERILVNIAGLLASELASIQHLPAVKEYMATRSIRAEWFCDDLQKGDLVVCGSSIGRQQNPWLVSFVVERGIPGDKHGCLLRAIGTENTCNYGNESFTKITGIPERLLWEGDKQRIAVKVSKAFKELNTYIHRYRGLEFDAKQDGIAYVFIGEYMGGLTKKTKPYRIIVKYDRRTTIKAIVAQMEEQGFGTREFEPDDGTYDGPMHGLTTFTRESLVDNLKACGIELNKECDDPSDLLLHNHLSTR